MTIAQTLYSAATTFLTRDDRGYFDQEEWEAVISRIRTNAKEEKEVCPDSCDSSIIFTFADGSTIYIAYPGQVCYSGSICLNW